MDDDWEFLQNIHIHSESEIDNLIEINEWEFVQQNDDHGDSSKITISKYALPICAQRILDEGVTEYQRTSYFRLAIHFKRIGLPFDMAIVLLKLWSLKNWPKDGKCIITEYKINSQTKYAYQKEY